MSARGERGYGRARSPGRFGKRPNPCIAKSKRCYEFMPGGGLLELLYPGFWVICHRRRRGMPRPAAPPKSDLLTIDLLGRIDQQPEEAGDQRGCARSLNCALPAHVANH